jgi:hypothetical protein
MARRVSGSGHGLVRRLTSSEELLQRESDVPGHLSQQRGGGVATDVKGDRGSAAIGVSVLAVGAPLPDLDAPVRFEQRGDFAGLENGNRPHGYATRSVWTPMNSDSSFGAPSSRSMRTTSRRFARSSSREAPCV